MKSVFLSFSCAYRFLSINFFSIYVFSIDSCLDWKWKCKRIVFYCGWQWFGFITAVYYMLNFFPIQLRSKCKFTTTRVCLIFFSAIEFCLTFETQFIFKICCAWKVWIGCRLWDNICVISIRNASLNFRTELFCKAFIFM